MRHTTFLLRTTGQTQMLGAALGQLLLPGDVIALEGDLGAGKTTLTKSIAAGMGIQDEVTSPTFTLVHEYRGRVPMFHLDPYRLERPEDLFDLGFEEYLDRAGVTVIEWADRLGSLLPAERLNLKLDIMTDERCDASDLNFDFVDGVEIAPRRLDVVAMGNRYEWLVRKLSGNLPVEMVIKLEPLP